MYIEGIKLGYGYFYNIVYVKWVFIKIFYLIMNLVFRYLINFDFSIIGIVICNKCWNFLC